MLLNTSARAGTTTARGNGLRSAAAKRTNTVAVTLARIRRHVDVKAARLEVLYRLPLQQNSTHLWSQDFAHDLLLLVLQREPHSLVQATPPPTYDQLTTRRVCIRPSVNTR